MEKTGTETPSNKQEETCKIEITDSEENSKESCNDDNSNAVTDAPGAKDDIDIADDESILVIDVEQTDQLETLADVSYQADKLETLANVSYQADKLETLASVSASSSILKTTPGMKSNQPSAVTSSSSSTSVSQVSSSSQSSQTSINAKEKTVDIPLAPSDSLDAIDEDCSEYLREPFKKGWKREIVWRNTSVKNKTFDVYYFPPRGKKLRSMVEVAVYLLEHKIVDLTLTHFSFKRRTLYKPPFEIVRTAGKSTKKVAEKQLLENNPAPKKRGRKPKSLTFNSSADSSTPTVHSETAAVETSEPVSDVSNVSAQHSDAQLTDKETPAKPNTTPNTSTIQQKVHPLYTPGKRGRPRSVFKIKQPTHPPRKRGRPRLEDSRPKVVEPTPVLAETKLKLAAPKPKLTDSTPEVNDSVPIQTDLTPKVIESTPKTKGPTFKKSNINIIKAGAGQTQRQKRNDDEYFQNILGAPSQVIASFLRQEPVKRQMEGSNGQPEAKRQCLSQPSQSADNCITKEIETQTVIKECAEKLCSTRCLGLEGIMPQRLCSVCSCFYHLECARKSKNFTNFMCFNCANRAVKTSVSKPLLHQTSMPQTSNQILLPVSMQNNLPMFSVPNLMTSLPFYATTTRPGNMPTTLISTPGPHGTTVRPSFFYIPSLPPPPPLAPRPNYNLPSNEPANERQQAPMLLFLQNPDGKTSNSLFSNTALTVPMTSLHTATKALAAHSESPEASAYNNRLGTQHKEAPRPVCRTTSLDSSNDSDDIDFCPPVSFGKADTGNADAPSFPACDTIRLILKNSILSKGNDQATGQGLFSRMEPLPSSESSVGLRSFPIGNAVNNGSLMACNDSVRQLKNSDCSVDVETPESTASSGLSPSTSMPNSVSSFKILRQEIQDKEDLNKISVFEKKSSISQILELPPNVAETLDLTKPLALKINQVELVVPPAWVKDLKIILPPHACELPRNPSCELNIFVSNDLNTLSFSKNLESNKQFQAIVRKRQQKSFLRSFKMLQSSFTIMMRVFRYLPFQDLLRASRVCKLWRTFALQPALWKFTYLNETYDAICVKDWKAASEFLNRMGVKKLSIKGLDTNELDASDGWTVIQEALPIIKTLDQLYFERAPASVLDRLTEKMPNLFHLTAGVIINSRDNVTKKSAPEASEKSIENMTLAVDAVLAGSLTTQVASMLYKVSELDLIQLTRQKQGFELTEEEKRAVCLCCLRLSSMGFNVTSSTFISKCHEMIARRFTGKRSNNCPILIPDSFGKEMYNQNAPLLATHVLFKSTDTLRDSLVKHFSSLQRLYQSLWIRLNPLADQVLTFDVSVFKIKTVGPMVSKKLKTAVSTLSLFSFFQLFPVQVVLPAGETPQVFHPDLIMSQTKDGFASDHLVTQYLKCAVKKITYRPLVILSNGSDELFSESFINDCIENSIYLFHVPSNVEQYVFPGSFGGILKFIKGQYKTDFSDPKRFVNLAIKVLTANKGQFYESLKLAMKISGAYPFNPQAPSKFQKLNLEKPVGQQTEAAMSSWTFDDVSSQMNKIITDDLYGPSSASTPTVGATNIKDIFLEISETSGSESEAEVPVAKKTLSSQASNNSKVDSLKTVQPGMGSVGVQLIEDSDSDTSESISPGLTPVEVTPPSQTPVVPKQINNGKIENLKNTLASQKSMGTKNEKSKPDNECVPAGKKSVGQSDEETFEQDGDMRENNNVLKRLAKQRVAEKLVLLSKKRLLRKGMKVTALKRPVKKQANCVDTKSKQSQPVKDESKTGATLNVNKKSKKSTEQKMFELYQSARSRQTTGSNEETAQSVDSTVMQNLEDTISSVIAQSRAEFNEKAQKAQAKKKPDKSQKPSTDGHDHIEVKAINDTSIILKARKLKKPVAKEVDESEEEEAVESMDESESESQPQKKKKNKKKKRKSELVEKQNGHVDSESAGEAESPVKNKKKKKKKHKKKSKNKESESVVEPGKENVITEYLNHDVEITIPTSSVVVLTEDQERQHLSYVSLLDHDYIKRSDSIVPLEPPSKTPSLTDVASQEKASTENEKSKEKGEDQSSDSSSEEKSSSDSDSDSSESDSSDSSDSSESASSSAKSSDSDSNSEASESEASSKDGSDEETSPASSPAKPSRSGKRKRSSSSESSSSEEPASGDSEKESELEEDDDSKCQMCMRAAPPHFKDKTIDWVDCDGNCGRWFHVICIIRSQSKADPKHYVCPSCKYDH